MIAEGENYISSRSSFQIRYCDDNELVYSQISFSGNQILFPEKGRSFVVENNKDEIFVARKPYSTTANGETNPSNNASLKWTLIHNGSPTAFAVFEGTVM